MEELENIVQVMIDRKENPKKIREVVRIWKERNPDKVKASEATKTIDMDPGPKKIFTGETVMSEDGSEIDQYDFSYKHMDKDLFEDPDDDKWTTGYEKELANELRKIYGKHFKFTEAQPGRNAITITPINQEGEARGEAQTFGVHSRVDSDVRGVITHNIRLKDEYDNIINYIEANKPKLKDEQAVRIFNDSGLTPDSYPEIQVGTEKKKSTSMYGVEQEFSYPMFDKANAEKTEEIIDQTSSKYRKLLRERADENLDQDILQQLQGDYAAGREKEIKKLSDQVRSDLEKEGIVFADDREWARFAGLGGEAYGTGLLGNILAEEADRESRQTLAANMLETMDPDAVTPDMQQEIEDFIIKTYSPAEVQKLNLEKQKRSIFNEIQELAKGEINEDVKSQIKTKQNKLKNLDTKIIQLGNKIGGEEGDKIMSKAFVNKTSKWRHDQMQNYKMSAQDYLNEDKRREKNKNPEISDWEAWQRVYKAKSLQYQKLGAYGETETIDVVLDKKLFNQAKNVGTGQLPDFYFGSVEDVQLYRMMLRKGYLPDEFEEGAVVKVPLKDTFDEKIWGGDYEGIWDAILGRQDISEEDAEKMRQYENSVFRVKGELAAVHELVYLNNSPEAYERGSFMGLGHGLNVAAKAMITHFTDTPEYEADKIVGKGRKHTDDFMLGKMQEVAQEYNKAVEGEMFENEKGEKVEAEYHFWTPEQTKAFEKSFMEEVGEGVGHFAPMLVELGIYSAAMGGVFNIPAIARALAAMRGGGAFGQLGFHATMAMVEEGKMYAAGFTPGTGAAFYVGGATTRWMTPFKNRFKYLDPIWQKVVKAGPIGASSSQLANVTALAYQDLMGNKNFKTVFDEMYGDLDQTAKDMLVESIVFSIVGATHLKGVRLEDGKLKRGVDLMSTREKDIAIDRIHEKQQEILKEAIDKEGKKDILGEEASVPKINAETGQLSFSGKPYGYDLLSPKQKTRWHALQKGKETIFRMRELEDNVRDLDPKNYENIKDWEAVMQKRVFDYAEKGIQLVMPEYKGFEVKYESNRDFFKFKDSVAEMQEGAGKGGKDVLLFDINKYTPGKAIHEITHAAVRSKRNQNENFRINFDARLAEKFGKFDFGVFKGTELWDTIAKMYGEPVFEIVDGKKKHKIDPETGEKEYKINKTTQSEEFLAYMVELLANPKIYRQAIAKDFFVEAKMELLDIYEEVTGKRPKIRDAKEFVEVLGRMAQASRRGLPFKMKAAAMAELDKADFKILEYEYNRDKRLEKEAGEQVEKGFASKDIEKQQTEFLRNRIESETPGVDGKKKETPLYTIDKHLFDDYGNRKYNTLKDFMRTKDYAEVWEKILGPKSVFNTLLKQSRDSKGRKIAEGVPEEALPSFVEKVKDKLFKRLTETFNPKKGGGSLFGYMSDVAIPWEATRVREEFVKGKKPTIPTGEKGEPGKKAIEPAAPVDPRMEKFEKEIIIPRKESTEKKEGPQQYVDMIKDSFKTEKEKEKYTKDIDKAVLEADINIEVEKPTYKRVKKELVDVEKITRKDKETGNIIIDPKTGKPKLFTPTKEADVVPIGRLPKVMEIVSEKYGIPLKRLLANQTLTDPMRTAARNRILKTIDSWKEALPEGETISGTATGIANTSWSFLYNFPGGRGKYAEGKTPAGKPPVTKRKGITLQEIRDAVGIDANGNFLKGTKYDSAIREYIKLEAQWTGVQSMMKTGKGRFTQAVLAEVGSGRSEVLASKLLEKFTEAFPELSLERARNIFINHALGTMSYRDAKYHNFIDRFKGYEWYFKNPKEAAKWAAIETKGIEGKSAEFSFVESFEGFWNNFKGKLPHGLTAKNIKGINTKAFASADKGNVIVDSARLLKHLNNSVEFSKLLPKEYRNSLKFLDEILGLHYRVTQEGVKDFVKYAKKYKAKSPEGKIKSFTEKQWEKMDTKGWEIIEQPGDFRGFILEKYTDSRGNTQFRPLTNEAITNVRERVLKVLGENTYEGFKNIDTNLKIKSAPTQAKGQKLMMEAGENLVKQLEIAEKYFSEIDSGLKKDTYFALESAKEQFIKDAKNKKEALERIEWMYNIVRGNSNLRMGVRQLVPVEWMYAPEGKIVGEKVKLEHLKAMIEHGTQAGHLIATGKFTELGKDIASDFIGITSDKRLLDIVDKVGGTTNTSGLYRMALLDPMTLQNFKSTKNPKITLFDAIMEKANKELFNGKIQEKLLKEKQLEKLQDQALKKSGVVMSSKNLSKGEKNRMTQAIDKALSNGRKIKKEKRGISVWDFDDTLARTKSGVLAQIPNPSGKPMPKRKVIFLAGGPGSGKSTVVKKLGLEKQGFKIVNQDISLEWLMKNHGLPKDMREFTREQASKWGELTWQARDIAKRKQTKFQGKGDGIIVDGTGQNKISMQQQVMEFKNKGYDVSMVFVETSLKTALERNKLRKERSLKDFIVKNTWESVMKNKKAYTEMFGENFIEIKSDKTKLEEALSPEIIAKADKFTKSYEKRRLTAEEFAGKGKEILDRGGKFDFSEFEMVREGEPGPFFEKFTKRMGKYGPKDNFVLTARPPESAPHIHMWLKMEGYEVPLKNIKALGNSTAEAKALWILEKFAEGYNDFYFADDALANVKEVKNVLNQLDVKSKVQQALASKDISKEINNIMKHSLGIEPQKIFTKAEAKVRGKDKKRRRFFITDSAADLELLIEPLYGKGKQGIENKKWFKENFVMPFERGIRDYNHARQSAKNDYLNLRKENKDIVKRIHKQVEGTNFSIDQAMRVYLWNKAGYKIPDLAKTTEAKLVEYIKSDPKLVHYAESFARITKRKEGLKEPSAEWWAETLAGEVTNIDRGVSRKQYLQEWIDIKSEMFSEQNLNKMESKLGTNWRENIVDMFDRMETGRTRSLKMDKSSAMMINYLNGSVGSIMNFNTRSAFLQTISTLNFLNMRENNPIAAARAMGNVPQFVKDFMRIMNSDMLKQRRDGLAINVSEAELASAAATSKNPIQSIIAKVLKTGYLPTKLADSFAISFGGATFYRNRIKMYEKQGMSKTQAEAKAWLDFQILSERTQQSSRADLLSRQQTSLIGRFLLPFANTPMQMNRAGMKDILDLSKGRYKDVVEAAEKTGRITYYMGAQVALFAGLQSALFAMLYNSDDVTDEKIEKTKVYTANTISDSFLRGMGVPGAVASGLKNAGLAYMKESKKDWSADYSEVAEALLNISPPVGSKFSKLDRAGDIMKWDREKEGFKFELGNPSLEASLLTIEALTNMPLHRWHKKSDNIKHALSDDYEMWQRAHMISGYTPYNVGIEFKKKSKEKDKKKETIDDIKPKFKIKGLDGSKKKKKKKKDKDKKSKFKIKI